MKYNSFPRKRNHLYWFTWTLMQSQVISPLEKGVSQAEPHGHLLLIMSPGLYQQEHHPSLGIHWNSSAAELQLIRHPTAGKQNPSTPTKSETGTSGLSKQPEREARQQKPPGDWGPWPHQHQWERQAGYPHPPALLGISTARQHPKRNTETAPWNSSHS